MGTYNVLQKFRRGIKSAVRERVKPGQACQKQCLSKLDDGGKVISKRGNMMFSDSSNKQTKTAKHKQNKTKNKTKQNNPISGL